MDGEISGEQLEALLDGEAENENEDLRIVDIRSPRAFEQRHIPGAENIPGGRLTDRIEELDGAERVVTVCPHGKASVQAARLIASYEGVDGPVESLSCGFEGWAGPVEGRGVDGADGGNGSEPTDESAGSDEREVRTADGDGSNAPF